MTAETLPPPSTAIGPVAWLRANLFSGIGSSMLTILLGLAIVWIALQVATWALTEARWSVVTTNLRLFLIGQFPPEEAWRVIANLTVVSVLGGLSAGTFGAATRALAVTLSAIQLMLGVLILTSPIAIGAAVALFVNAVIVWVGLILSLRFRLPRRPLVVGWLLSIPATFLLLNGLEDTALPSVSTNVWGGLLLTVMLAVVGILLSFPLGVLLALGRRSDMPAVRALSTGYIEIIRGVPLVTILFMADIILPLFLPGDWRLDRVARAMGGITIFSAAYVAENVRGGLQAIPTGQVEAAHAIGLNTIQTNLFIVLPQALRSVIPANVGLFISLLKDTTLVTIIGLLEILGIGRAVLAQPDSFGANLEVYAFVAGVFFVLCYAMSQASYRLEQSMGVGSR